MPANTCCLPANSLSDSDRALIVQFMEVLARYKDRIGMVIAALDTPKRKSERTTDSGHPRPDISRRF